MSPFDYGLCRDTVTLYRPGLRRVARNCHLAVGAQTPAETWGKSRRKPFLLIIPAGADLSPQTGDRIFAGVGPETVDWDSFVPALIPELYEVSFVKPCCWDGELTHWEAGNRKEIL